MRKKKKRITVTTFVGVVLTVLLVLSVRVWAIGIYYVSSSSMENTILRGDYVIADKLTYTIGSPERGDILTYKTPSDNTKKANGYDKKTYIDRCVAIPGDIVKIENGMLYVNGERLNERYLKFPNNAGPDWGPYTVPEKCYFVLGDNRCESGDSRIFGPVPEKDVTGKVTMVYFSVIPNAEKISRDLSGEGIRWDRIGVPLT